MKKYITYIFIGLLYQQPNAQVTGELNVLDRDAFYLQYTPDIATDDFTYKRISGKLSIPPIRLKKLSLFTTIGLDIHQFDYKDNNQFKDATALDKFYNVNLSLFANYKFSDKWSLNILAAPYIASNLEENLTSDDYNFNGLAYLERTFYFKKGGYIQLDVGAGYLTLNGTTTVNPVIQAKARFNENWSAVLGIPNTYVKWDINKKHSLKVLGEINDFSANLNGTNSFGTVNSVDRAVFTSISSGVEYNYWITSSIGIMLKATQSVWDNYELRNTNNESIYEFNTSFDHPFIGLGIKFNPIRSLQNSLNPL
jgi:hypothetical protein